MVTVSEDRVTWNGAPDLEPLLVPIDRLSPMPGNPRRGAVDAVARSYERFGQMKPIVARRTSGTRRAPHGVIVAGNHQREAAEQLGWSKLAVVWIEADEATATAYGLADNRTSDIAAYDQVELLDLLRSLEAETLEWTGYSTEDVNDLLRRVGPAPTLEELGERHGEPVGADLWPSVSFRAPLWLVSSWRGYVDEHDGDPARVLADLIGEAWRE